MLPLACSKSGGGGSTAPTTKLGNLPNAVVGSAYLTELEFPYGDATSDYRVSAGALPEGLVLAGKSIRGIAIEPGRYGFEVQVRQAVSLVELGRKPFTLTVDPDTFELKVWTRRLVAARNGTPYGQRINTTGGEPPYRFSVAAGVLPTGLVLNPALGTIDGMPAKTGVYAFTIQVEDAQGAKTTREMYIASLSSIWGRPLVSMQSSQLRGPAPLAVFFDASGTRSTRYPAGWHDLLHDWRFDDPGSHHASTTGPLASHVFDRPGVHHVRLTSIDADGLAESMVLPITVEDPDVVFAGLQTCCFSNTDDFTGAPEGSRRIKTDSFDTASSYIASGRRLLFRRGDTFRSTNPVLVIADKPTSLGAFGLGVKPDAKGRFANNPRVLSLDQPALLVQGSDVRITDLVFSESPGRTSSHAIGTTSQTKACLVYRVETTGYDTPVSIPHSIVQALSLPSHEGFTLADSSIRDARANSIEVGGLQISLQGNTVSESLNQSNLEIAFARKAVIDGNSFENPAAGGHCAQIHALDEPAAKKTYGDATKQIVIRGNVFRGDTKWLVNLGPRSATNDELVEDVLIEKNLFLGGEQADVHLHLRCVRTTVKNNIFASTGAQKGKPLTGIAVTKRGVGPSPSHIRILHNTFFDPTRDHSYIAFVDIDWHLGRVQLFNNLVHAPWIPDTSVVRDASFVVRAGNLSRQDPGFVDPGKLDLRLKAGSLAIDAGVVVPVVDDYAGNLRKLSSGTRDTGALRFR